MKSNKVWLSSYIITLPNEEIYFKVDEVLSCQVGGVAIGLVEFTLAVAFLCHNEMTWLGYCFLIRFTVTRYLFSLLFSLRKIKFLPLKYSDLIMMYCQIYSESGIKLTEKFSFHTSALSATCISLCTHFDSHWPIYYMLRLVSFVLSCSFSVCSELIKFHQRISQMKQMFIAMYVEGISQSIIVT